MTVSSRGDDGRCRRGGARAKSGVLKIIKIVGLDQEKTGGAGRSTDRGWTGGWVGAGGGQAPRRWECSGVSRRRLW